MRSAWLPFALLTLLLGCGSAPSAPVAPPVGSVEPTPASQLVFETGAWQPVFERETRARRLVVLDLSADWCPGCSSMEHLVFHDRRLIELGGLAGFLRLDVDNPAYVELLDRYPIAVLPSFVAIDPSNGRVFGFWRGSATVPEFDRFVRDAVAAHRVSSRPGSTPGHSPALHRLLQGHGAAARGQFAAAFQHYSRSLELAPPDWPRRQEAQYSALMALHDGQVWGNCAQLGAQLLPELGGSRAPSGVTMVLACAGEVEGVAQESAAKAAIIALLKLANDPPPDLPVTDKAEIFALLAGMFRVFEEPDKATQAMSEGLDLLETAARSASTPELAAVFDPGRIEAYEFLKRPADALKLVNARVLELPDDPLTHRRRAQVLEAGGKLEDAAKALRRAILLARSPRRERYQQELEGIEAQLDKSANQ